MTFAASSMSSGSVENNLQVLCCFGDLSGFTGTPSLRPAHSMSIDDFEGICAAAQPPRPFSPPGRHLGDKAQAR